MHTHAMMVLAALAAAPAGSPTAGAGDTAIAVYVGTYTSGESRGIYRFSLDPETGKTTVPRLAAESENPSFLAIHPDGRHVYAVTETDDLGADKTGGVTAFEIEAPTGALRELNQQPSKGAHPCHLVVDAEGKNVLVANYSGGNLAVVPIGADGRLKPPSSVQQHVGSGPNLGRQKGPHAHGLALAPDGRFAFAADLGADRVFVHRFDASAGALEPHDPPAAVLAPGSGPRHVVFHPSGSFLYAIGELLSTVTVFRYDSAAGILEAVQTLTTLPAGFEGENTTAEIAVSPDGRFLYGSNRGHDSLAVFSVDAATGRLAAVGHVATGGRTPRHFAIDPTGRWLLAANQGSDTVVVFRRDPESGLPSPVGEPVAVPKPVCLLPVAR